MARVDIALTPFILGVSLATACGLSVVGVGGEARDPELDASASSTGSSSSSSGADDGSVPTSSTSSGSASSSGALLDAAPTPKDSGPPAPLFGETCPTGTTYVDDFSTDPTGRWLDAHAMWTWDKAGKMMTVTGYNPHGVIWIGPRPNWGNYSVEMSIRVSNPGGVTGANAGPLFRIKNFGTPPLVNNEGQMFFAGVVLNGDDDVIFGTENDGWTQNNQVNDGNTPANEWLTIRVESQGAAITVFTNGTQRLSMTNNAYANGSIGIKAYEMTLSVRRVEVKCL